MFKAFNLDSVNLGTNGIRSARSIALALSLSFACQSAMPLLAMAEKSSKKESAKEKAPKVEKKAKAEKPSKVEKAAKSSKESKVAKENKVSKLESGSSADQPMSTIGLPSAIGSLINQGRWKDASIALEKKVSKETDVNRDNAWLAFAYLYLGKNEELKKLADDCEKQQATSPYTLLVKAFYLTLEGKFEVAEKLLLTLPPQFGRDPLANFALSLVTAKQGKASVAVAYSEKAVELDPRFAWGFRTLGYLEQRWLEDTSKAEEAYSRALLIEPTMTEAQDALVDLRLARNDFDGAIDAAKSAIAANNKMASNHYRLAQIYTEQWRLRDASEVLQKAIDIDGTNPRYFRSRASIKSFQGNLNSAIADQQKAVELSKDKAFELIELSNMNVLAGNNNRAAENLSEALKLEPDNVAAHDKLYRILALEKRFDDLILEAKRLCERKPKDHRARMELAQAYLLNKQLDLSIEQYKEAAGMTNTDPEPWRRLGSIYIGKREWAAAARAYTHALNVNASSVSDLVALGYCYAQDDDYMKAEAAFVTALALQQLSPAGQQTAGPSRTDVMRSLAGLLVDEGRYADAVGQYDAISLLTRNTSQNNFDLYMLARTKAVRDLTKASGDSLILAYGRLSKEDKEKEAVATAEALVKAGKVDYALGLLPEDPTTLDLPLQTQAYLIKSRASAAKGDLDAAVALAKRATEVKDDNYQQKSEAWIALAEAQLKKKENKDALDSANKALESYGKSPAAYVLLGRLNLADGDSKNAVVRAKKALEFNPYYAAAYLLMGDAQLADGTYKEAASTLRKAVELYPGWMEAHRSYLESLRKQALIEEIKREEAQIAELEQKNN